LNLILTEALEPRRFFTAVDVLSYRYDPGSNGVNSFESILTPTNVKTSAFGKRFTTVLDGEMYANPVYKLDVNITRGPSLGPHNVVFCATEHDSLYAIDAYTAAADGSDSDLWLWDGVQAQQIDSKVTKAQSAGVVLAQP